MNKTCKWRKNKGLYCGRTCAVMSGKIRLPVLQLPPTELFAYTIGTVPESKHFLQNIRQYDSCFKVPLFEATSHNPHRKFSPFFEI